MHTTHAKHHLNLDKMLGEKNVELNRREQDLDMREVALVEAQSRGLNPRDNHEELMEFIELRNILKEADVECVTEVGRLVNLVKDVSMVLVDPRVAGDILEVVGVILERLLEAYASNHGPWD
jgi:hypothetical protein